MIGELIIAIIFLLPSIFLLLYLKKERRKWQKRGAWLNEELEKQSFRLLETESRLKDSDREREALEKVVAGLDAVEPEYIPLPLECKERELRPARKETLLLVENSRQTLFMLGELLKADYNLLYAENSDEALQKMAYSPRPQLLICPVNGRELDGIELFNRSRSTCSSEPLPFIFICKGAREQSRITSLKEESLDFIDHLSLRRELRERVANRLALQKLFSELYQYKVGRRVEERFEGYCKTRGLKGKQKEVARLIMDRPEGTNLRLGEELAIAQNTLRTHIKRIGEKLGLPGQKRKISIHLRTICYDKDEKYQERAKK